MAKEYQAVEKARRASEHNDSLSRQGKASLPRPRINENSEDNPEDAEDASTPVDESPKSRFEPGDRISIMSDQGRRSEPFHDYSSNNVQNPELPAEQQARLIAVLKNHDNVMTTSGNALPPPAYGVVWDIDVGGDAPIKQRARRIPLRQLKKLYELLKGLLKAGLIAKKNGLDIRLCIDYKLVNAVTMIMEYAMPLVDDLLADLEAYLWFCSLDATGGFWAIMMTVRAQERADRSRQLRNEASRHWSARPQNVRTKFDAVHEDSVTADPVSQLINSPDADMFTASEADTSTLVPVFDRRSFVDDICFGGKRSTNVW
ncbi:unnamed protein product [Phytophthora fragariaefolia]|uniref:Unnamed protein product n=1 Tax=Phytophthora fragariaefolia TaxID=1490495 RepID=A0A9W7D450_9STRA|nr:unnamed protein product [Phytophthora fragariaefolia]